MRAALDLGRFVSDDVAVQVGQHNDLEVAAALVVEQLRGHDIDVPVVKHDFRVFLSNLLAGVEELAVGRLDDVRLGDAGNTVLAGQACEDKRQTRDTIAGPDDLGGRGSHK